MWSLKHGQKLLKNPIFRFVCGNKFRCNKREVLRLIQKRRNETDLRSKWERERDIDRERMRSEIFTNKPIIALEPKESSPTKVPLKETCTEKGNKKERELERLSGSIKNFCHYPECQDFSIQKTTAQVERPFHGTRSSLPIDQFEPINASALISVGPLGNESVFEPL